MALGLFGGGNTERERESSIAPWFEHSSDIFFIKQIDVHVGVRRTDQSVRRRSVVFGDAMSLKRIAVVPLMFIASWLLPRLRDPGCSLEF